MFNPRQRRKGSSYSAILSYLGIPYTDPMKRFAKLMRLQNAIYLRYIQTRIIDWRTRYRRRSGLTALIVKPNHEGSGKGIGQTAVVDNAEELKAVLDKNFKLYGQPMLIEQFISGREFTVGVLGNGENARAFEPMEIRYLKEGRENRIYSFHVKTHYKDYVEYICPPLLDDETNNRMKETALKIHRVLSCRDFSRIDFRLSDQGDIYFIEINPLPGLAPSYSDYPMIAEFCGMSYKELILSVFNCALERYGMKPWNPNRGE